MTLRLSLSILISLITGWLVVGVAWPERSPRAPARFLRAALGCGLGLGISSQVYFLWLLMGGASLQRLLVGDLLLLAALTGLLLASRLHLRTPGAAESAVAPPAPRAKWLNGFLAVAALLALLGAVYVFVSSYYREPHGGWDAWMSWNLRARFFFRGGEHWRDAFSGLFWGANPSYPVLLPSVVARSWQYAGEETVLAPVLVAALFTFSTAALLYAGLRAVRSPGQGLLGALLLLGTPLFVQHGTFQMADVPIGFFFLASIVTLCAGDRFLPEGSGRFFLAAMAAGFAASTKSDGWLFLCALSLAVVVGLARGTGLRSHARQALAFAGGLLVVLPLTLYVKTRLAPADIMLGWDPGRLHSLVEWGRYGQILKAFGAAALRFGEGPLQMAPLLVFYALLLRTDPAPLRSRNTIMGLAALGMTLVGYGLVYLTTPYDLAWQLRTSLHRLLLQLWPSAIFLFLVIVKTPEQARAEEGRG